jgi:rhodanese-related sulfurtransferase
MTTMTAQHTTPSTSADIEPRDAQAMLARGEAVLVDVREPDEHAREHIADAVLMPLGALTPARIRSIGSKRVLIHCKSGRRGGDAAARCSELAGSGIEVRNVRGGIEAWRAAGLPTVVDASRPKLGVLQQTQLAIGIGVLAGTALGAFVNPWFLAIPAFMGCGLLVAGATGFCGLATVLAKAPWNKVRGSAARGQCSTTGGSCCS